MLRQTGFLRCDPGGVRSLVGRSARLPIHRPRSDQHVAEIFREGAGRPKCVDGRIAHLSEHVIQVTLFIVEKPILRYAIRHIELVC